MIVIFDDEYDDDEDEDANEDDEDEDDDHDDGYGCNIVITSQFASGALI